MKANPETIAIDGPAASGKSTVGQSLADRLHYLYFDTGAMYRAVTYLALQEGHDLADDSALGALAEERPIEIEPPGEAQADGRQYTVRVDDRDITWDIRHHLVDINVSQVAAHPSVRQALRDQQRRIGLRGEVVMVGRDIGTVVLPEAPLKVYLDASLEERARRRHRELEKRGVESRYEELLDAMRKRDRIDSSRAVAPLRVAEDAVTILCDRIPVEDVVERILALWSERVGVTVPER